jgi:hypothetical protein
VDDARLAALEEQVTKLSRSNRRFRGLAGVALAFGMVALFSGQKADKNADFDTVVANTFGVRGKKDKYRAILGVDDKGTFPNLQLLDNKERVRVLIGLEKDGSGSITFYDKDGNVQKTIAPDAK